MTTILVILQVFIISVLVLVILLQKTSADGLSGLAGGGSGVMSGRGVSNFFTKLTALLAAAFLLNSLVLAKLESNKAMRGKDLLDKVVNSAPLAPSTTDVISGDGATAQGEVMPMAPSVEEDALPQVPAAQ